MKNAILITLCCLTFVVSSNAQGVFWFINPGAHTRIGTLAGPEAGPDILGQMFLGETADSLTLFGTPKPHQRGLVLGGNVTVPGIPGHTYVFAQMVAWDGTLWGSVLADVPMAQRGYTDVVPLELRYFYEPLVTPRFNQPAIVPVPEPSVWALLALAGSAWFLVRSRARSHSIRQQRKIATRHE